MHSERRAILDALTSIADSGRVNLGKFALEDADGAGRDALQMIAGIAALHRTFHAEAAPGIKAGGRVVGRIGPTPADGAVPVGGSMWNGLLLIDKLGEGASADVYRAHDPLFVRDVALKLFKVPPANGTDLSDAVLREGRALASLRHEHIAQVYGVDVQDGRVGLWMELVDGRTLEAHLAERGLFGAAEAAVIGQDICRALSAVHQAGLVHGDVKAQNVIREAGGRIVLTDFGSGRAQWVTPGDTIGRTGTPLYLAPELLAGGAASVATDIYALGVLLFHLITGDFPVRATSLDELRAAHAAGRRLPVHDCRTDVSEAFARVVDQALQPNPAHRYHSAGEMHAAIAECLRDGAADHRAGEIDGAGGRRDRRVLIGGLILALAGLAVVGARNWLSVRSPTPGTVAVIPFFNAGPGHDADYLAAGLSDEVTVQLSRLAGVRMITGTSVRRAALGPDASDAGCAIGASTVVTGSVQVLTDVIRVNVRVITCNGSRRIVADSFDGRRAELFPLQARVALGIAQLLKGRLSQADAALLMQKPVNQEAYDIYLQGRYFWNKRTPEALRSAIEFFQRSIDLQPDLACAHAGLADAYVLSALYGVLPPSGARRMAMISAERALQYDASLAEAHAAMGLAQHEEWQLGAAAASYRKAVALNPNYAAARQWYAILLAQGGNFETAQQEVNYALSLDPASTVIRTARAVILYDSRDYQGAVAQFLEVLKTEPDFATAHVGLAEAYAMLGYHVEALRQLDAARATSASDRTRGIEAWIRAAMNDRDGALQVLSEIEDQVDSTDSGPIDVAAAYAAVGDRDRATLWLRRGFDARDRSFLNGRIEPRYDRLIELPLFNELFGSLTFDPPAKGAN